MSKPTLVSPRPHYIHTMMLEVMKPQLTFNSASQPKYTCESHMALPLKMPLGTSLSDEFCQHLAESVGSAYCIVANMALATRSAGFAASKVQQAQLFIQEWSQSLGMNVPQGPLKFELVGDVLMIPEHLLVEKEWDNVDVWSRLALIYNASRIARKRKIDSGLLRQSCVTFLYPTRGKADETGPGSPGWVTVVENKISFSFDITRVMFCSGNVTERMRAAHQPVKGETIVDLYCGIGYYTVPFIVHGGAAVVHACEWNADSVLALKHNLLATGGEEALGRCHVHQGDNRVTVREHSQLHDVADRVSLGLLPSSVDGWPLAARCLKPDGGVLHVHQNVDERHREAWLVSMCQEMERLFSEVGKLVKAELIHLEKVKSYAPHIDHVVADVCISPAR